MIMLMVSQFLNIQLHYQHNQIIVHGFQITTTTRITNNNFNFMDKSKGKTLNNIQRERAPSRLKMINTKELYDELPSKEVIQAIETVQKQSNKNKVIASDVARYAGISINEAKKYLTTVASYTQGDIAVTSDGELMYTFDSNLNSKLSSNNLKFKIQNVWDELIWPKLFYGIRVSFGVMLLVSLVAIFSTLAFINSSSSSNDDRDDRRGPSMSFGSPFGFFGPSPFDFFYYRPYYSSYDTYKDPEEMGFFESTFSYIFGDGDPNRNKEQESLSTIANFITVNNGVVTAEQLAPLIAYANDNVPSPPSSSSNEIYVDESFVLPIVTKLNGIPEVTPDGDIIYVFSDLQQSSTSTTSSSFKSYAKDKEESLLLQKLGIDPTTSTKQLKQIMTQGLGITTVGALERSDLIQALNQYVNNNGASSNNDSNNNNRLQEYLQEEEYQFSLASSFQQILAGGLGAVNLIGAIILGQKFSELAMYGYTIPSSSIFGIVQSIYPLLLTYAILFNVIPLGRYFWIQKQNTKINAKNSKRRLWNVFLKSKTSTTLRRKLSSAINIGNKMKKQLSSSSGNKEIIFDTSDDFQNTQIKKEESSLSDFDKLLE